MASRPSEDELIARYFRPLAGEGASDLLDDAASIRPLPGCDLVLTADALVSSVHFFPDDSAGAIAWKALAVNLSDLAAKGATPLGFLLSLALPQDWTEDWLANFCEGLRQCADASSCQLLGGDTVMTPGPLTLSITAIGTVPEGGIVLRTGARPGDLIFASGTIGDAALGLRLRLETGSAWALALEPAHRAHLLERYLRPQPRLGLAPALLAHANGAMDVSDGLVGDVVKMGKASGVGVQVDLDSVKFSDAARAAMHTSQEFLQVAVTGGDDYEVLCTVPQHSAAAFRADAEAAGIAVTSIGVVTASQGTAEFHQGGKPVSFTRGSFSHF
jgi:thiamine-monophosphate kinase